MPFRSYRSLFQILDTAFLSHPSGGLGTTLT